MVKLVAFDFDGTLADSVDFCLSVFDSVLEKYMGENAPSREEVYARFGMNEEGVLREFLGRTIPQAEQDLYQLHSDWHSSMCPELIPGCRDLLNFLKEQKVPAALITGRSPVTCGISLKLLGLEHYFVSIQTGSPVKNDKTAQLESLMQKFGLQKDELVYVGDAVSDALASQRAGVACLSAAWTGTARLAELKQVNPDLVFEQVQTLQTYLASRI